MTTGEIISLLALAVAALTLFLRGRGDVRKDAGSMARIDAVLGRIDKGVDDIRVEQRAVSRRVQEHGERLARLEDSVASAHNRCNDLDAKFLAAHPPDKR